MKLIINNGNIFGKYIRILLLSFICLHGSSQTNTLTAISNVKGAPSSLNMSELKSVLKGEKQRWGDGTRVTIVLMKTTTPVGEITCQKIYNMNSDKVRRFWLELSFSGKATAPTFCNTIEELESIVSQTSGAIGITDKSPGSSSVKVISVDGKNFF